MLLIKKESAMSITTEPEISLDEFIQASAALGSLIRIYSFRSSRDRKMYGRISRHCLALRVHGKARKAVRVAIAALDETSYEAIRASECSDQLAQSKAALMRAMQ
jgi:hypothetical protein